MFTRILPSRRVLTAMLSCTIISTAPAFAQTNAQTDDLAAETGNPVSNTSPIDEIIVTGSILSATSHENLIGVSVLTNEKLQRHMSGSLGETLKFEPGISSSFFGAGASRPIIRGQGGLRVVLLDNGIGSIDASSASPDHAAAVEPAMANRIEIVRGAGLLRYGSSASGGVVNVIDGRIPDRIPSEHITGNARIGVSSIDKGYETALGGDIALGQFGTGDIVAHAELSHRKTEDYRIPGFARSEALRAADPLPTNEEEYKTLSNSATKATSLATGLSYIGETVFIGAAIKDLNSDYGIPGGEGATIRLDQTRYDFSSRLNFKSGPFERLNVSGGAADYIHQEIEPSGEVGTTFTNEGFETRVEIVQNPYNAWQASHGVQYKKRTFSAIGEEAFVPPTTTHLFGAFSFHEFDFDSLHLDAAMRYEHVEHEDLAGTKISFNGFSGSIGADTALTDTLNLGLTAYRTERAPTTEELFSNGPHLATGQFEIGAPDLGIETATGVEMSMRYQNGNDHLTLNVFYTDYADYVYETITGAVHTTDEGDTLSIARFTPADAVFKGFEVDIAKDLGRLQQWDISADASLEYVKASLSGSKTSLPRIPPLGINLGFNMDTQRWGLRAELEYAAAKTDLAFAESESKGYVLINGFVTYELNDAMTLRLSANNLTNKEARQHTSALKENLPLPGRNIKASLAYTF